MDDPDRQAEFQFWRKLWLAKSGCDRDAWRRQQSKEMLSYMMHLAGLRNIDIDQLRVLVVDDGLMGALNGVKAKLRVSLDPNHAAFDQEGLLDYAGRDPEVLYVSAALQDDRLAAASFDLVFLSRPVRNIAMVGRLLASALRVAAPGARLAINLTLEFAESPEPVFDSMITGLPAGTSHTLELSSANGQPTLRGRIVLAGGVATNETDFIRLQYPMKIRPRWTPDNPNQFLLAALRDGDNRYLTRLRSYRRHATRFAAITAEQVNERDPYWNNEWIPILDGISLYAETVEARPDVFLEIGSGNSTKFVRRAINDHGLPTRIISIDPNPRADIDRLCDLVHRVRFEDFDFSLLKELHGKKVVVYFDGSHYAYQNTDATVFFLEFLPSVPHDWLIGVHDIIFPHDYMNKDMWFFNEQYLLAPLVLSGAVETLLPSYYVSACEPLRQEALQILPNQGAMAAWPGGAIYWFKHHLGAAYRTHPLLGSQ
jgi:hypothetical protein